MDELRADNEGYANRSTGDRRNRKSKRAFRNFEILFGQTVIISQARVHFFPRSSVVHADS